MPSFGNGRLRNTKLPFYLQGNQFRSALSCRGHKYKAALSCSSSGFNTRGFTAAECHAHRAAASEPRIDQGVKATGTLPTPAAPCLMRLSSLRLVFWYRVALETTSAASEGESILVVSIPFPPLSASYTGKKSYTAFTISVHSWHRMIPFYQVLL